MFLSYLLNFILYHRSLQPKVIRTSTAFVKENNNFTPDFTGFVCSSW